MARLVLLAVFAFGLGGCAVTAVVGAAATVVGAGAKVAGSAVSATVDVVGAGVSGAIELATSDDDDGNDEARNGHDEDGKDRQDAPSAILTPPLDETDENPDLATNSFDQTGY